MYVSSNSCHLVPCNPLLRGRLEIPFLLPLIRRFAIHINTSVCVGRYHCVRKKVLQFECFDEITVPDHAPITNSNVDESFIDFSNLPDTFLQRFFSSEDRYITYITSIRKASRYVCITFCMSRRILAVGSDPLACLILSRLAIDVAPRSAETGLCGLPTLNPYL